MSWFKPFIKGAGFLFAFVAVAIFSIITQPYKTSAYGTISNTSISLSDTSASATATYTISFDVENDIPATSGRIHLEFLGPYSYSSSGTSPTYINFNSATIGSNTSPNTISILNSNWSGVTLSNSSEISAGTTITLELEGVVNPSTPGYHFAHIWTTDYSTKIDGDSGWGGDYPTSYFEIGDTTNVTGTITDQNGDPLAYTNVNLYSSGGNYNYYYTYTDADGVYGFGSVPAGSYTFSVYAPYSYNSSNTYFPPDSTTLTVGSSGTTTKNAQFSLPTKNLSGTVRKNSSTSAVVADATVYAYKQGGSSTYVNVDTDSSGAYSLNLTGGTWQIGVYPKTSTASWTYSVWDEKISFDDDTTTQTKTKNFIVDALDSTITGTVQKPDKTAPDQWSVSLSFSNSKNQWFSASVGTDGTFSTSVSAGTYKVSGWSSDSNFSFPSIDSFSVADSETVNLGVITLVEKTDTISGTITDNLGDAVSGASVSAWKNSNNGMSSDWANATTASDGTYSLKVTPGIWQVSPYPQWESGYVYSAQPTSVTVESGVTATQNFVFQKSTATINGKIVDENGDTLTSLYAWVGASDGSQDWSNIGTSVDKGIFTLKVPAGTWEVSAYVYYDSYSSPDPTSITIADNETKSLTLQALKNDATISGTVKDEDGNAVTGKWISIYATKGKHGTWRSANFDQATGAYSISVAEGTWNLGWWVDQNLGYSSGSGQDVEIAISSGETKTQDITLKKADSTISGTASQSDGSAMAWAWITADSRDPNEKTRADSDYYYNGNSTDNSGQYTLTLPAGTYWVGGSMWVGSGFINPKRQKVTVDKNNPATVDLVFRVADATITGTTTQDGSGTSAYITGWSEDGAYSEANSNNAGAYTLNVSSDTKWHLKAVKKVEKTVYKSAEKVVDLTSSTSASQDFSMTAQSYTLPDTQTITFDPTQQQTIKLDDGTVITIPANTIATSGSITLTIEPDIDLAEQDMAKPLSYGYNITAIDENGETITNFNGNITIEYKYQDEWVSDAKVIGESGLSIAYFDEASGTWRQLDSCTVNETENTVTCQVNHFTKFSIISASDTTAPNAPTSVSASAGDAKVNLSWTNPTSDDFAGIKIYRSEASGATGELIKTIDNTSDTSYEDSSRTNGTTYYYIIKSYDTSGNESTNTDQVSAKPTSASASADSSSSSSNSSASLVLPKTGAQQQITLKKIVQTALVIVIIATIIGGNFLNKRKQQETRL